MRIQLSNPKKGLYDRHPSHYISEHTESHIIQHLIIVVRQKLEAIRCVNCAV